MFRFFECEYFIKKYEQQNKKQKMFRFFEREDFIKKYEQQNKKQKCFAFLSERILYKYQIRHNVIADKKPVMSKSQSVVFHCYKLSFYQ